MFFRPTTHSVLLVILILRGTILRKCDDDFCSGALAASEPDASSMCLDDALDDRQAQSGSTGLRREEWIESVFHRLRRQARTVTGNKSDVVRLLLLEVTGDLTISTGQDTDLLYLGDESDATRVLQQIVVNGHLTLNTGGNWDDVAIEAPVFVLGDFSTELGQGSDFFGVGSYHIMIMVGKTFYLSCGQGDDLVNIHQLVEEGILLAEEVVVVGCDD
jgi:hypothetical protein